MSLRFVLFAVAVWLKGNRSIDARLCKVCFSADMAEMIAEDILEDSMTDSERCVFRNRLRCFGFCLCILNGA